MKSRNFWRLLLGMWICAFLSHEAYCADQSKPRSAMLIEQITSLAGSDIEAKASVVSGFGEKNSYKDEEVSFVVLDGGEIEVVGETKNPKSVSDYSNKIAVNDLGHVEVSEIMPVTINGIRKVRFVLRVTVDMARNETVYGVIRKSKEPVTLQFLHEACLNVGQTAGGMIPYFDCESYVYGVLDSYLQVRSQIPISQRACFPVNIPPWRVLEISAKANLSYKFDDIAAPLLIEALRKRFPCAKQ